MQLAKIVGTVVSTIHHPAYDGRRVMLCELLDFDEQERGSAQVIALDRVQAGVGDTVLILKEGTGVRQLFQETDFPVRSVIVAVVDSVSCEERGA